MLEIERRSVPIERGVHLSRFKPIAIVLVNKPVSGGHPCQQT